MKDLRSQTRQIRSTQLGKTILFREWGEEGGDRGPVLLLHGLGDHSGRHDWAAGLIHGAGYRPVGFDWPGNGGSEGRRGEMPTTAEARLLIDEILESRGLAPEGIFAHSTGAFLILSRLFQEGALEGPLQRLRWVWLNSPLLCPSHGQPAFKIAVARHLARHFPNLTLSTGVRVKDCFHTGFAPFAESERKRAGGHHRITLRFAVDLLQSEKSLFSGVERIDPNLSFLLVQGAEDPVCPPLHAEALYRRLPSRDKTWLHVSGARHEAFREAHAESLTNAVRVWLRQR